MVGESSLFSDEGVTNSERSLHTPGNFARQNLLYVQEVGRLESLTRHRCVRENLNSWLFMIVLDGKGSLIANGRHYEIHKGDCAWIDCREHYEHISDEFEAWKLAWVHFNGFSAGGYYQLFLNYNQGLNVFSVENIREWDDKVGEILDAQKINSLHSELRCGELLLQLLNNVINTVMDSSVAVDEQEKGLANEIRLKLNENYPKTEILKWLEEYFGTNIQRLNEIFLHQYGIRIEEYISNRRLNAAKELLRFSIQPPEQIAQETGIRDIIVMEQMFRESEGVTVEEYRAKWAAWIR